MVTVGTQEATLLTPRALVATPTNVLPVVTPRYEGTTEAARLLDIPVTAVEERDSGFTAADLEEAVCAERARGRHPRAVYLVPDHSDPSGNTMSLRDRADVLELAAYHALIVLEGSPYRLVSPGRRQPTCKSLDRDRRVVYFGSYAKALFPGARVAFAVTDQYVRDASGATTLLADELAKIKGMVTVNTPTLSQAAVGGALPTACWPSSTPCPPSTAARPSRRPWTPSSGTSRRTRRRALGVSWNEPGGGFFLIVRVSFVADDAALLRSAEERGVLWTPMSSFCPRAGGERAIRLSFSHLSPARITDGIPRLASFVEAETGRAGAVPPS